MPLSRLSPAGLSWALISLCITATLPVVLAQNGNSKGGTIKDSYDYVIVGGGTSGLTVGDRLSESGKYSVLAIEYGYIEPDGLRPGQNSYNITSAPATELKNKTFSVDVGCIVGGSSAVNGRALQRGTKDDYDIWSELGGSGPDGPFSWKNLLKYFKRGLQLVPPNPDIPKDFNFTVDYKYWGSDNGNKSVFAMYGNTIPPNAYPLYQGTKQVPGVNVPEDGGNGELGLLYYMQATDPRTGNRSYARTAHWDDLNRPNYDLLVGTRVNRIVFEGTTAVGVQITPRGGTGPSSIIKAKKEVILAAGTIHTPQILQLSGVGPADLLKKAGIKVKVDLPGVGANFQDHTFVSDVSFRWGTPPPVPQSLVAQNPASNGISRTYLGLSVPLSIVSPNYSSIAQALLSQSSSSVLPPNTDPSIVRGYSAQKSLLAKSILSKGSSKDSSLSYLRISLTPLTVLPTDDPNVSPASLSLLPINIHPFSRGTVQIDAVKTKAAASLIAASEIEPIVDYRALTNPLDIQLVISQIRFLRSVFTSPSGPFGAYNASEISPGAQLQSDEDLEKWIRDKTTPSVYHPVGTCAKMERRLGGVVDEELKVYGTNRLRIIDASIFPLVTGATTSMSVYAVAEKAADLIKADQKGGHGDH